MVLGVADNQLGILIAQVGGVDDVDRRVTAGSAPALST